MQQFIPYIPDILLDESQQKNIMTIMVEICNMMGYEVAFIKIDLPE